MTTAAEPASTCRPAFPRRWQGTKITKPEFKGMSAEHRESCSRLRGAAARERSSSPGESIPQHRTLIHGGLQDLVDPVNLGH